MKITNKKTKEVLAFVLSIAIVSIIGATYNYLHNKKEEIKIIEQDAKVAKAFEEIEKALKEYRDFMENLCFAHWKSKELSPEIASILCKCEIKQYSKTLSIKNVGFIINNLETFDFLLYKKDTEATEIMEKIKAIRLYCIEKNKNGIKKHL